MATIIRPDPWPHRVRVLPPQLIPHPSSGAFVSNGGAGQLDATGFAGTVTLGGVFDGLPGVLGAVGAPGDILLGDSIGFDGFPGALVAAGFLGTFGADSTAPPPASNDDLPFDPALSEIGEDVWERLGKPLGSITAAQFGSMRRSMNFVLSAWSNKGINLWRVEQMTIPLLKGVDAYSIGADVVDVLDTYRRVRGIDTIMAPVSRNVFASYPNKLQQGVPTQFWVDKQRTKILHVWPVPDASALYEMRMFVFKQIVAVDPAMGLGSQLPYSFLEAFAAAVAAHLAVKWAPDRLAMLQAIADRTWDDASTNDVEKVDWTIVPDFSAYFG